MKNELKLEVCAGPPEIPVPDYYGWTKKDYISLLDSLNIKYKIAKEKSATVKVDYVIKTSIAAGNYINIEKGEVLTVTICDGVITTTTTTTTASQQVQPSSDNSQASPPTTDVPSADSTAAE